MELFSQAECTILILHAYNNASNYIPFHHRRYEKPMKHLILL